MPSPQENYYTARDYWNLPEGTRAELIGGKLYDMAPPSRRMDYATKTALYMDAGVREYWVCDPDKAMTTVYLFEEEGFAPVIYPFGIPVPVRNERATLPVEATPASIPF